MGYYLMAGAAPFILLQLIFNVGVTGSLLRSPFTYLQPAGPADAGVWLSPVRPGSPARIAIAAEATVLRSVGRPGRPGAYPGSCAKAVCTTCSIVFGFGNRPSASDYAAAPGNNSDVPPTSLGRVGGLPLFLVLYTGYTLFLPHYALLVAPAWRS